MSKRATQQLKQASLAAALMLLGCTGLGLVTAGNTASATTTAALSNNIGDYVASRLDDFTATMRVTYHDDNALRKINKDFGMIYKLQGDVRVHYKDENKLRLDARLGASSATLIVNGTKQYVRLSGLGIKDVRDLGESPGKRKTLLDVGMLSHGYLAYTHAEFRGTRPVDGVECAVFRVSYRDKNLDTSHRIIWVDPRTKVVLKREEYSQEGKLNAIFYYRAPHEVAPGVWFPSRIEVFNNENQRAGETVYRDVHVNTGLEDKLFRL
ncbi:MAG TPA: outer membrane lipoprotein-sorting protein [Chthonomonadaceae bacterium]|nr:outer membrane lipoprotein-sorting protein [Chthonomonadaceae bacterium]